MTSSASSRSLSSSARIAPCTALRTRCPISWSCASTCSSAVSIDIASQGTSFAWGARQGLSPLRLHLATPAYPTPRRTRRTLPANPEEEENQMPRNGKLVRISLVAAAAAAIAVVAVVTAGTASAKSTSGSVTGAGSTFVAPLVAKWQSAVQQQLGLQLNYNAVGSGGGVSAITNKQVDFGASDAPLSQFSPTCTTCVQIPWALAATGVIYNLSGLQHLKMTGSVLAQIYLGKITKWNAPAIKKLNKGKNLPGTSITVVHRSDSSGTTFNFTDYLSHVSGTWNS